MYERNRLAQRGARRRDVFDDEHPIAVDEAMADKDPALSVILDFFPIKGEAEIGNAAFGERDGGGCDQGDALIGRSKKDIERRTLVHELRNDGVGVELTEASELRAGVVTAGVDEVRGCSPALGREIAKGQDVALHHELDELGFVLFHGPLLAGLWSLCVAAPLLLGDTPYTAEMPSGQDLFRRGATYVRGNGKKLGKYLAVTVGSYVAGQALLGLFLYLNMSAFVANTLSFVLVVGPNYIGNRYWVWALRSKNSIKGEIVPFWILNVVGYAVSSIAVVWAESAGWPKWGIVAASTIAFGIVWVIKLFVFEKFLFGNRAVAERKEASDAELVSAGS